MLVLFVPYIKGILCSQDLLQYQYGTADVKHIPIVLNLHYIKQQSLHPQKRYKSKKFYN